MGFHTQRDPRKTPMDFPNKLIFGLDFYQSDSKVDSEATFFGFPFRIDLTLPRNQLDYISWMNFPFSKN